VVKCKEIIENTKRSKDHGFSPLPPPASANLYIYIYFIAINDKRKRLPWVFMCAERGGKES